MYFKHKVNRILLSMYDILYTSFSEDVTNIVISYLPHCQIDNTHRQEIINLILHEFSLVQLKQLKIILKQDFEHTIFTFIPTSLLISAAYYVVEKLTIEHVLYKSIYRKKNYAPMWQCSGMNGSKFLTENWQSCQKMILNKSEQYESDPIYTPLFNDIDCYSLLPIPNLIQIKKNQYKCIESIRWHQRNDSYSIFEYDPREYNDGRMDCIDKPNIYIYCKYHVNTKLIEARFTANKRSY